MERQCLKLSFLMRDHLKNCIRWGNLSGVSQVQPLGKKQSRIKVVRQQLSRILHVWEKKWDYCYWSAWVEWSTGVDKDDQERERIQEVQEICKLNDFYWRKILSKILYNLNSFHHCISESIQCVNSTIVISYLWFSTHYFLF